MKSGVVTVRKRIDYEKVENLQFKALAWDNVEPKMTATATVYVQIKNINDNSPQFLVRWLHFLRFYLNNGVGKIHLFSCISHSVCLSVCQSLSLSQTHTCTLTHTHAYTHKHTYIRTHTNIHAHANTHAHTNTHKNKHTGTNINTHKHTNKHIHTKRIKNYAYSHTARKTDIYIDTFYELLIERRNQENILNMILTMKPKNICMNPS